MKGKPYGYCINKIMGFIQGNNLQQGYFSTLEDQVSLDLSEETMAKLADWLIMRNPLQT